MKIYISRYGLHFAVFVVFLLYCVASVVEFVCVFLCVLWQAVLLFRGCSDFTRCCICGPVVFNPWAYDVLLYTSMCSLYFVGTWSIFPCLLLFNSYSGMHKIV